MVLCSSGGFFGRPDPAEDEDAYAARIWRVSHLSELVLLDTDCSNSGPACHICRALLTAAVAYLVLLLSLSDLQAAACSGCCLVKSTAQLLSS